MSLVFFGRGTFPGGIAPSGDLGRQGDGAVKDLLDSGGVRASLPRCGGVGGPCDEDAGEGLGDEKAIPGTQGPGAKGESVEGANLAGVDEGGELGRSGLGDEGGAAGAVGGDGADASGAEGALE